MNIFQIIGKLYTTYDCKWISELENNEIQPVIIQKFLSMNVNILDKVRKLDKYVFTLPPKMYLALAWSVIPKYKKAPYNKYLKEVKTEEDYDEILIKMKKIINMSDNDYKYAKKYFLKNIRENPVYWFSVLGIDKKIWKKYGLNFKEIKNIHKEEKKDIKQTPGLFQFIKS